MDRVLLKELNMKTRNEVLIFLKKLWNEEETHCPICGDKLELLHKKAKRSNCDCNVKLVIKLTKQYIYLMN